MEILGVFNPPPKNDRHFCLRHALGNGAKEGKSILLWERYLLGELPAPVKEKAKMETIDPRSVKNIRLKVYLADYQGSDGKISSDLTTIPMK